MTKKYMCHSGYVLSKDGDTHFISAYTVMRLYGLESSNCTLISNPHQLRGYSEEQLKSIVHLQPRSDGSYTLPKERANDYP